jgi:polyhydroxyalkanoate synthesis regulator phasin
MWMNRKQLKEQNDKISVLENEMKKLRETVEENNVLIEYQEAKIYDLMITNRDLVEGDQKEVHELRRTIRSLTNQVDDLQGKLKRGVIAYG